MRKWSDFEEFPQGSGTVSGGRMTVWQWVDIVEWASREKGLAVDTVASAPEQWSQLQAALDATIFFTRTEESDRCVEALVRQSGPSTRV